MNLVKEKQRGLIPPGLQSWPLQLIEHLTNTISVAPPPAGPHNFNMDIVQISHADILTRVLLFVSIAQCTRFSLHKFNFMPLNHYITKKIAGSLTYKLFITRGPLAY